MMFQVRDEEDPESRAGRLARDRDHHAQVIKKSVNDDDLANDNLYIIGECLSRKMSTLPNCLKSSSLAVAISFFKQCNKKCSL